MNKTTVILLLFAMFGLCEAHTTASDRENLALFRQNVVEIGNALHNYYLKERMYPLELSNLTPQYLKEIPLGPDGAILWDYRPNSDLQSFQFGVKGQRNGGEHVLPTLPTFGPQRTLSPQEATQR